MAELTYIVYICDRLKRVETTFKIRIDLCGMKMTVYTEILRRLAISIFQVFRSKMSKSDMLVLLLHCGLLLLLIINVRQKGNVCIVKIINVLCFLCILS